MYFEGGRPFEYHNDEAKTAAVTNERGWRTLGDIGRLDEDGYLYLTDRQAHMIISGGVNIYPQEAENVLVSHELVADCAVIGVPDLEMGEAVKAVVQLVDPADAGADTEAELIALCRTQLATYKCPRSVDFVAELPRDPNGKLYKRVLKEHYWEGHESRRAVISGQCPASVVEVDESGSAVVVVDAGSVVEVVDVGVGVVVGGAPGTVVEGVVLNVNSHVPAAQSVGGLALTA